MSSAPIATTDLGKLYLGDCLEVMAGLPDETFRVIVTSPPYNLRNSSGNGMKSPPGGTKWANPALSRGYNKHDDNMPLDEYVEWQRACMKEMFRLLRPDGAIFYNHKRRVQRGIMQDRDAITDGFPLRQIIIWQRSGGHNWNAQYFLPTYENIYFFCHEGFKLAPKANAMGDVWRMNQERNNPHPAPFPVELPLRCIKAVGSGPVLDPFMGSGTTALAAEHLGQHWVGIDHDPESIVQCKERLGQAESFVSDLVDEGSLFALSP